MANRGSQKIITECVGILSSEDMNAVNQWLSANRMTSYKLRNEKAAEVIALSSYMMQKMSAGSKGQDQSSTRNHDLLHSVADYYNKNSAKCLQYAHLIRYFSRWDYEFQYIYDVALDREKQHVGLYLRVRENVLSSAHNKTGKEILSSITAEQEEWCNLARFIVKDLAGEDIVERFMLVVKNHFMHIKKSQTDSINGAEFFKICRLIVAEYTHSPLKRDNTLKDTHSPLKDTHSPLKLKDRRDDAIKEQVKKEQLRKDESLEDILLKDLKKEDKQLIRVLSYKDKNIARLLEEKHAKMVHSIGQEVNSLREAIHHEKERYVEVLEEKKALFREAERIKEASLRFLLEQDEKNEANLLLTLQSFNKKYNSRANDVTRAAQIVHNRRLINIIEREELEEH